MRFQFIFCALFCLVGFHSLAQSNPNTMVVSEDQRSVLLQNANGQKTRIMAYGQEMVRIQTAQSGEEFFADDRYTMVESHDWEGFLRVEETDTAWNLFPGSDEGLRIQISKNTLRLAFFRPDRSIPMLAEYTGTTWSTGKIRTNFLSDPNEKFSGLGHGFFGRENEVNLAGRSLSRNYGRGQGDQAPLIVPFFFSNKGYGFFLNSPFTNRFTLSRNGEFEIELSTRGFEARMDYFIIYGPEIPTIMDHYTQLTGRPRMPLMSYFGLAMSDKAAERQGPPTDENWWMEKILAHREAGFPLDHVVNDNMWRAGGGTRLISVLEWETERYPLPERWKNWTQDQGLIVTLDFNRGMAKLIDGWEPGFNIPETDDFDVPDAAPDFTNPLVRQWFWDQFWLVAMDQGNYPGDAFWIDEFDQMGGTRSRALLSNGRTWYEMQNHWFQLIAETLVRDGWDVEMGESRRPFVWIRGGTAGMQRYATIWTGDIQPNDQDMAHQVVSMQLAGLSGFPFWSHDAGGFYDGQGGPDENLYQRWGMALGSFTPFWKPHGMGESRWPLDRSQESQASARYYSDLRYSLMPYTYSLAHEAHETGMPMARALILDYPLVDQAWETPHQFLWGPSILVSPQLTASQNMELWIPPGIWYDFANDQTHQGPGNLEFEVRENKMPLLIKSGAIIPMTQPALSTAFLDYSQLEIQVYLGEDGVFELYEDDGVSERFRTRNELRITEISWMEESKELVISPSQGSFPEAVENRNWNLVFHGVGAVETVEINDNPINFFPTVEEAKANVGASFQEETGKLYVAAGSHSPENGLTVRFY